MRNRCLDMPKVMQSKVSINPTVSVIIPTHNRADLLRRAIKSVLAQTFKDFEIIVVDDASKDNTEEVVKGFQDARIRYIRHAVNKGGSAARNTGIKAAIGEFIGLLDDDDEWLPEKLAKQLTKFQTSLNPSIGIVYSGFYYVLSRNGEILKEIIPLLRGKVNVNLLEACILGSATPLVKKVCFLQAGLFDEKLPSCQDWDMWLRISKKYEFDFISEALAKAYVHGVQISSDLKKKIVAREIILGKYQDEFVSHPHILGKHYERLGILSCLAGFQDKGNDYFKKSIKVKPKQVKSYIHLCLNFIPKAHMTLLTKFSVLNLNGIRFFY